MECVLSQKAVKLHTEFSFIARLNRNIREKETAENFIVFAKNINENSFGKNDSCQTRLSMCVINDSIEIIESLRMQIETCSQLWVVVFDEIVKRSILFKRSLTLSILNESKLHS